MAEIRSHDFSFDLCVVTKYGVSVGGNNIVAMRPGLGIALRTRRFFDVIAGYSFLRSYNIGCYYNPE